MNTINYTYFLGCIFLIIFSSCKHNENEYHHLTDKIEAKSKKYNGVSISSEAYIGDIKTVEITEGHHTFLIPDRKSQITSYTCTDCHSKPLTELKEVSLKKAHWDIMLEHANQEVMNCATCHNGNNMDHLLTLTGKTIDFNKSYRLCAQCHSNQFEDWKGGAHGKNIGGWANPRAVMTCVNCHNPHKPKIESRWPSRFNTQKVKERE
ncbi:cytochrome c3 family protein [Aquimarina sp. AU474]|uniref:cytochrome c3 family protein n=1 Tax=Aquimarina sp. AU474 TaxID=2108529 RepID=UPI000D695D79|nr:cytochrome c3 family protein [Aquimarina sp. AU474]